MLQQLSIPFEYHHERAEHGHNTDKFIAWLKSPLPAIESTDWLQCSAVYQEVFTCI